MSDAGGSADAAAVAGQRGALLLLPALASRDCRLSVADTRLPPPRRAHPGGGSREGRRSRGAGGQSQRGRAQCWQLLPAGIVVALFVPQSLGRGGGPAPTGLHRPTRRAGPQRRGVRAFEARVRRQVSLALQRGSAMAVAVAVQWTPAAPRDSVGPPAGGAAGLVGS